MAGYTAQQLGLKGNFKDAEWIQGRNYDGATQTFGDVNQIWSRSLKDAGQQVSKEVRGQSAAAQGVSAQNFDNYLRKQAGGGFQNNEVFGGDGGAGFSGMSAPSKININEIYDKLMNSDEMKALQGDVDKNETEIQKRRTANSEALGIIDDNPFYAEATRVGKNEKQDKKFQRDVSNYEMAKATAVNKLTQARELAREKVNIQVQQYDMDRTAANDALNKFNSLLSAGALDGAGADDIAGLAGATGLSAGMIYSAVNANKKKSQNIQVIMDDYGNATLMDVNTGDIINRVAGVGGTKGSGGGSDKMSKEDYISYLKDDVKAGDTLGKVLSTYGGYLDGNSIYSIYNSISRHGPAKESAAQLAKYGINVKGADDPLD